MSMILSASVVRVRDGLPLSASTDYEQSIGVQQCTKYFKTLSKKLAQLPDRCMLKAGQYNINFISSLGVSYMMLCTENYPCVLAFCFLDELQKEFITTYNMMRTNTAIRPYCFIEFDNFIQRTKQRYNNPRSLSTKINLADMQTEIKLRPPYQISMSELGSVNGFAHTSAAEFKGTGKIPAALHQRLEPITLPGIVAFILSLLCGALNLIRGFHAIESLLQNESEDFSYVIAFFLGTAACLYQSCPCLGRNLSCGVPFAGFLGIFCLWLLVFTPENFPLLPAWFPTLKWLCFIITQLYAVCVLWILDVLIYGILCPAALKSSHAEDSGEHQKAEGTGQHCYLFVYCTGWRNVKSFLTFGLICLCNMYLYELRNLWQLFFHVTVGAFSALQIQLRQPQGKSPDYSV